MRTCKNACHLGGYRDESSAKRREKKLREKCKQETFLRAKRRGSTHSLPGAHVCIDGNTVVRRVTQFLDGLFDGGVVGKIECV